ncbi:zinc finger protein 420 [Bicyclus anynana]|uniref:Zinc finger protein 420 n=1 Tax=Bicyclus anynana TaxID=110368 RepID=A0ABM3M3D4_BICAN|nr:zinc finger protein 420 [Bicyclus anynana]
MNPETKWKTDEMNRNICRVCLTINTCTFMIGNTNLQNVYERIADVKLNASPELQYACYVCYARLKQCERLIRQAKLTEELLKETIINAEELQNAVKHQQCKLKIYSVVNINVDPCEVQTKVEEKEEYLKEEDIKNEADLDLVERDTNEDSETEIRSDVESKVDKSSDSEDDIPLRSIRSRVTKRDKLQKERSKKIKQNKDAKLEAKELHLDEKQQMEELMQRSKSLNYLNSPYKCDLCYRGFRDPTAYSKHKDKHDLKSGHLECKICRLRYSSRQALNSHSMAAHSRRFICGSCPHISLTKNQAVVHERWHNGHQYPCKLCDKRFIKPTSYLSHMRKAHCNLSQHVCHKCGESFAGRHGLLMHMSKTHRHDDAEPEVVADPTSDSYCKECGIQFLTLDAYNLHLLSSQKHKQAVWKDNGSKCRICDKPVSQFDRTRHERMHAKELKPRVADVVDAAPPTIEIPCPQCSKTFTSRSKLQMHIRRMHLGQRYNRNVVCEVCGKHCTSNATLRYHQRAHTGERPYACALCAARFVSREHWRLHQRVHSGERPYACALCGHRFAQKPALNRHYIVSRARRGTCIIGSVIIVCVSREHWRLHQRVHSGERPYACALCGHRFAQKPALNRHYIALHSESRTSRNILGIIGSVIIVCVSREHWRLHQRVHSGERPYACAQCGHRFAQKPALNRHYIVHTGAKPYECHLCNKSFTQSASMKKHIQRVHLRQPQNRNKNGEQTDKNSLDVTVN